MVLSPFWLECLVTLRQAEEIHLPFIEYPPSVPRQALGIERIIFTVRFPIRSDRESLGRSVILVGRGLLRTMIEEHRPVVLEESTPPPAVTFRPEGERSEPGRLANRRPCVGVLAIVDAARGEFAGEVDELRTVGRQVAAAVVDAPVEPMAALDHVVLGIPPNELDALAGPAAENDGDRRTTSLEETEARSGRPTLRWGDALH